MNDRYLWDRTGDVDPDVARLEETLRPLAHAGRPLDLRRPVPERPAPLRGRRAARAGLALAATLALAVGAWWLRSSDPGSTTPSADTWMAEPGTAAAIVAGQPLASPAPVAPGTTIETGASGGLVLRAGGVGTIALGPGTSLRLLTADSGRHWFRLERGTLEADISAPPGVFAVGTPAAQAIDLGCRYTLEVGPDGSGSLHVTLGWVGLTRGGRESLVPAGAICAMRAGSGPGTPYFEGASPAFVTALAAIDDGDAAADSAALSAVLAEARPLDAITLWHLLARLRPADASRVYDRLAQLTPPPAVATREAVLAANQAALAAWWDAIGLGDLSVLRAGLVRVP